jgi:hypothetical protein
MGAARFRLWFDAREASVEELARFEEIEVTQEVDHFWEARARMAMCLDDQGRWKHRPDQTATAFSRVRIALDPGDGSFVPLIDGPVVRFDSRLDSQPGRSTTTFVVRDDSVFLNRDEDNEVFRDKRDSEVADALFRAVPQIASTRVDPPTAATHPVTSRRGTRLDLLTRLSRANRRRAYVLPGEQPGQSVGCFLADPQQPNLAWPALELIGDRRNLGDATIEEDPDSPSRSSARTLRLSDGSLASFQTGAQALGLSNDRPALPDDAAPLRQLPPEEALREDPEAAVSAAAERSGLAYKLTTSVIPGCYHAVLLPYQMVRIECGDTPYSGNYFLTKVTHRITPSVWTQSLEGKRHGATEVAEAPAVETPGSGLSISFSASVGVF